jgi:hypothetical protein
MTERKYAFNDWENLKREADQRSAVEVPGFHARTVIDDTIGKLWRLRQQLRIEIPDGLAAVLDDIEELVERAVDIGLDPDAPEMNDGEAFPAPDLMNHTSHLRPSASNVIYFCSCGQPGL